MNALHCNFWDGLKLNEPDTKKKHYTKWLIGILILVYHNPHRTGENNPLYIYIHWTARASFIAQIMLSHTMSIHVNLLLFFLQLFFFAFCLIKGVHENPRLKKTTRTGVIIFPTRTMNYCKGQSLKINLRYPLFDTLPNGWQLVTPWCTASHGMGTVKDIYAWPIHVACCCDLAHLMTHRLKAKETSFTCPWHNFVSISSARSPKDFSSDAPSSQIHLKVSISPSKVLFWGVGCFFFLTTPFETHVSHQLVAKTWRKINQVWGKFRNISTENSFETTTIDLVGGWTNPFEKIVVKMDHFQR